MRRLFTKPLNWLFIFLIRCYQKFKRRKYAKCLHYPSCSNYGILAFKKYDFFTAFLKTLRRYNDCNPFSNRPFLDYP